MSKITLYIDCVSPYAFFAFHVLETYRHIWKDVEVTYVPIALGVVMKESGNRPPIVVANKGKWMHKDIQRTVKELGLGKFSSPPNFPYNSFPAMRALAALRKGENENDYLNCARALWRAGWTEHKDMSKPETFVEAFSTVIPQEKAKQYVKAGSESEAKEEILATTKKILADGAFGLPWFDVTNKQGETEHFFGNDRWVHITDFLGVEWKGLTVCQGTPNAHL
ncbi:putative 2-hydroxychromene-2-carboxylate isomerase [Taphrina deformans PYCC 5710]|uniref:Glutathione S-transferase kappa n=1 Tax=Taphrina deformans (strain PYCC 5710 / ATCC 11124 / CBS 356.35 / IMI 108563 / JCM 9778 / NBRC 8474) TaxID=1097556 RepID=R4X774_TAPDE|nr:putative 2-hydroxychromene-2-carboxylate isomerase [Taphrina deformans PYCC 5710]|eukprot:CCG81131.1 putative 2-hydroxychromene-2-carboxylate isomerase [Taphrina deformans PYCC 5710]